MGTKHDARDAPNPSIRPGHVQHPDQHDVGPDARDVGDGENGFGPGAEVGGERRGRRGSEAPGGQGCRGGRCRFRSRGGEARFGPTGRRLEDFVRQGAGESNGRFIFSKVARNL